MSQLDALRLAEVVKERLVDFSIDDNFVQDKKLSEICRTIWSGSPKQGGLLSELWVEAAFPSASSSDSLKVLAEKGLFNKELCEHLHQNGAVPKDRPLYLHQVEAIKSSISQETNKPCLVITAGTGSGKTESFLLPVLNQLYNSERKGQGIRCLILYPMNALVNDQVGRIYEWLNGQDKLTLFHFTSETPENKSVADKLGIPTWHNCRMRTRQQARGLESSDGSKIDLSSNPIVPDILITNYSMLEYMLCRPQDAVFFGSSLSAVVLDEAHLYTGTLAAEITLLLRRLLVRCGVKSEDVLQIATSATLGTGKQQQLQQFASTIFSKQIDQVKTIEGRSSRLIMDNSCPPNNATKAEQLASWEWFNKPLIEINSQGESVLATNPELYEKLYDNLPELVDYNVVVEAKNKATTPSELLYQSLKHSPLIHRLEMALWENKRLSLDALTTEIWDSCSDAEIKATVKLLQLSASARNKAGDYPLVPHRIHFLARACEGLVICLNKDCSGKNEFKLPKLGAVIGGIRDSCDFCGSSVLSLFRCSNCGEYLLAAIENRATLKPAYVNNIDCKYYKLVDDSSPLAISIDPRTGKLDGGRSHSLTLMEIKECLRCESGEFEPFSMTTPITLSILTETILTQLPEFPSVNNLWLPARGRRMLVFSDSRQEAARMGPSLRHQHESQMIRAAVVRALHEVLVDEHVLQAMNEDIARLQNQLNQPDISAPLKRHLIKQLEEQQNKLSSSLAGGAIEVWEGMLFDQPLLAELLDSESGLKHRFRYQLNNGFRYWSQVDWEKNWNQIRSKTRSFLAQEFARPGLARSLESVGLVEVTYPGLDTLKAPDDFIGLLPTEDIRNRIASAWSLFLQSLCDTLRINNAVTLGSPEEDQSYPYGNIKLGAWCSQNSSSGNYLISFVGEQTRHRRRGFANAVLKASGLEGEIVNQLAGKMLEAAFKQLLARAVMVGQSIGSTAFPWLERQLRQSPKGPPVDAIRIVFQNLALRPPLKLYKCSKTGKIWCRSVLGCTTDVGSLSTLEPVTNSELDLDPRVGRQRKEFRHSSVFELGLWAEEHSAQLSPQENQRLQDLFKVGLRNILSSTTTLELGIDIGGLNSVLMSNVPPGKANYLQRAGRAGRRADGSSIVVTFARPSPYDREVFYNFDKYISKNLRQPLVFLDRDRVVRRHLHSFLLGTFFKAIYPKDVQVGAMAAFGYMGRFCGFPLPRYWDKSEIEKPELEHINRIFFQQDNQLSWWNQDTKEKGLDYQFLNYLKWRKETVTEQTLAEVKQLFKETSLDKEADNWPELIDKTIKEFERVITGFQQEYNNLLEVWSKSSNKPQANAIRYQLSALYELTVIEALADRQFLPHYGFPIGVHKLRVISVSEDKKRKIREEDQYRLERRSLLAIREYVPGSQLLVGGKLVSSQGLLKHWTGAEIDTYLGLRGQYCLCKNGHFFYWMSKALKTCPICQSNPASSPVDLLIPKHGFSTAAWDPPKWSTNIDRVGSAEMATVAFTQQTALESKPIQVNDFADIKGLKAFYREDGEILIYNRGNAKCGFAICLQCGYAESETSVGQGIKGLSHSFLPHSPLSSPSPYDNCWKNTEQSPVMRNQTLAAKEVTDICWLDFSQTLGEEADDVGLITTIAYALRLAGAQILELDTREIGVIVINSLGIVIYDNIPGGAGHVRELLSVAKEWLVKAKEILFVNEQHNTRCKTACLDCLLSFESQDIFKNGLLKREYAFQILTSLIEGKILSKTNNSPTNLVDEPLTGDIQKSSKSDKLKTAQDKLAKRRKNS